MHLLAVPVLLALGMHFTGCSEPSPPPQRTPAAPAPVAQPITPQGATPETPVAVEVPKEPVYAYKPAGRIDPFAPIIEREEKKEKRGAVPPLERYALSEFKLTGIIWGGFGYNAMLEAPDGKGYFIRMGTVIGLNRGVVKRITRDSLVVVETFKNYMGVKEQKELTIKLQKKQEGLP